MTEQERTFLQDIKARFDEIEDLISRSPLSERVLSMMVVSVITSQDGDDSTIASMCSIGVLDKSEIGILSGVADQAYDELSGEDDDLFDTFGFCKN